MTPEFNKEHYQHLKAMAKQYNVHTAYNDLSDSAWHNQYKGLTVAFSPATELDDNRMIEVSVSYCAQEDTFKKKIGKYHALRKFFEENNFVHLPFGQYYRTNSKEEMGYVLLEMFNV